ncbi:MAG TPA: hypothetical protein VFK34_04485 [Marmoricola sp.]|jgi:uncharacterized membrane protein YgaE (UPF0421/DUF939 family)|nr:hypothetical protein [Marmoricola sp.]
MPGRRPGYATPVWVVGRAIRSAVAAVLAWLVILPWGGIADQYPYYAPMGAVIAVTATVAGAFREVWRTALAIAIGAALALVTAPLHLLIQLFVVVGLGTVVSGWKRLGDTASWVPIAGLFVLVFDRDGSWDYPVAYIGLTTVGALVGLAVTTVWPPLPLKAARTAAQSLRDVLCDQLDILADALSAEDLPDKDDWQRRSRSIDPALHHARDIAQTLEEAREGNWRAARWKEYGDTLERQVRALDAMAFLVEDVTWFLSDRENAGRDDVAIGPRLRPQTAEVFRRVSAALRSMEGTDVEDDLLKHAEEGLDDLVAGIRDVRRDTDDDMMAASGVVTTVHRTLDTLR